MHNFDVEIENDHLASRAPEPFLGSIVQADDQRSGISSQSWLNRRSLTVGQLLPEAKRRLFIIGPDARLVTFEQRFVNAVDILAVCHPSGRLAGIITKTMLLSHLIAVRCASADFLPACSIMSEDFVRCGPSDRLGEVYEMMHKHDLWDIPIVCEEVIPLGIVNAGDALRVLLDDSVSEDLILSNYIMGVGYR
jgi:CBS domain-containing protein